MRKYICLSLIKYFPIQGNNVAPYAIISCSSLRLNMGVREKGNFPVFNCRLLGLQVKPYKQFPCLQIISWKSIYFSQEELP